MAKKDKASNKATGEMDDFSLEDSLREIKDILEKMRMGDLNFDENIKLFTKGKTLIRQSQAYLDQAEISIQQLIETEDGTELQDFE